MSSSSAAVSSLDPQPSFASSVGVFGWIIYMFNITSFFVALYLMFYKLGFNVKAIKTNTHYRLWFILLLILTIQRILDVISQTAYHYAKDQLDSSQSLQTFQSLQQSVVQLRYGLSWYHCCSFFLIIMLALFIVIDTYERIIVIDPRSRIGMSFHSSRILVPISSVIVVVLYSALYFSLLSTATTSQWTPPSAPYSLMTLANSAVSLFSYIRMAIEGISILFSLCLDYYLSAKLVQLLFAKAKEGGGGANNTSGNNLFSNGGGGGGGGTGVGGGSSSGGGTSGNGNDGVGIRGHTRQKLRMPPLQRQNFENMKLHDSAILSGANNSSGNILPAADQASTESSNHSKQNSSGRGKNNSSSNTGKKGKKSSSKSGGGGGGSSGAKNSFNTSLAKARQRQERQESKRKIRYKIAVTTTVYLSIMFVLDLVMFGSLLCTAAYPSLTDYYAQLLFILVGSMVAFRVNILYYRVEILLSNLKRRRGGKSSSNGNLANSSNSARARREAAAMTSSVEYIDDRSIASNRHKNSGVFDQDQRQDSSLERANMKDGGRLAHGDEMDWFNPNVDIIADPVALDPNSNDEDSDGDGAGSVDDDERYGEDLNVNAYILPPTMLDSGLMDSNISGHSLNTPEGGFNGGDSRPSKGKQKLVSLFPGLTVSSGTPKNQHNRTASTGAPSLNRSTNPVPQHYMHHQKKGSNGSNIIFLPPPLLPVPQQQQNQNDSTGNSFSSYNNSMDRPAANSSAGNTRRQQRQPQHLRGPSNVSSKLGVSTTLSTGGNSLQANNNNNSSNRDLRDDDVEYPSELPPSELDYSFD